MGFGSAIELTPVGLSNEDLAAVDAVLADAESELQSIELDDVRWADDADSADVLGRRRTSKPMTP